MEHELLRYGGLLLIFSMYPILELRRILTERRAEREGREIPDDAERILTWFENRSERRRKKREAGRKKENMHGFHSIADQLPGNKGRTA